MKFFQKWKDTVSLKKDFQKLEKILNEKYIKIYETKTNTINKEIKNKQKAIDDFKENEKELYNSNKQIEKEKEKIRERKCPIRKRKESKRSNE